MEEHLWIELHISQRLRIAFPWAKDNFIIWKWTFVSILWYQPLDSVLGLLVKPLDTISGKLPYAQQSMQMISKPAHFKNSEI